MVKSIYANDGDTSAFAGNPHPVIGDRRQGQANLTAMLPKGAQHPLEGAGEKCGRWRASIHDRPNNGAG
jgi:hypothetical protein